MDQRLEFLTMLKVRRATANDHLGVFKLAAAMHAETDFKHYTFSPLKTLHSISEWDSGDSRVLFVVDDGKDIVGMMAVGVEDAAFSNDIVAAENVFFVRSDMRGTRAAYLLMREFLSWSEKIGAKHIRAGVATGGGAAACRLYEHFGMQPVGANFASHIRRN